MLNMVCKNISKYIVKNVGQLNSIDKRKLQINNESS